MNLCPPLHQSPEVTKLQGVLNYLAKNRYNVNLDDIKGIISHGAY